jgi:hypothetical protein
MGLFRKPLTEQEAAARFVQQELERLARHRWREHLA